MARQPEGQNCENCRYAVLAETRAGETRTFCQRFPPVYDPSRNTYTGEFPITSTDWWCGEWSPNSPETVSDAATTLARLVLLGDRTAAYALVDKLKEERGDAG